MTAPVERVVATMSPSKLDLLNRCGHAFGQRYFAGIKEPPTAALAFGRAFDEASNGAAVDKLLQERTPPTRDVQERFAASWDQERHAVEDWRDDDPATLMDRGVGLAAKWNDRFLDQITPHAVQPNLRIDVVEGDDQWAAIGYADLIATPHLDGVPEREAVIDQKATLKRWGPGRLMSSTQAPFYVEAMRRRGVETDRAIWCIGLRQKKPKLQVLSRRVDRAERDGILARMSAGRKLIRAMAQSGTFLPNRQNPMCSRRWCAYWRGCEKAWGGKVPE